MAGAAQIFIHPKLKRPIRRLLAWQDGVEPEVADVHQAVGVESGQSGWLEPARAR